MKVDIEEVHSVFAWTWHIPKDNKDGSLEVDDDDDVCGICRASYNATCPSCKYPGDKCSLVVGECNHNFHVHCIYRWLDTTTSKGLCPMCRQLFQLKRGLAINDSQLEKFKELQLRKRTNTAGEFADEDDEEAIERAMAQQDQAEVDDQGDVIMDQGLVVR
ncbi:hypothetical protein ZYGR_0A02150 [Zygosaccharomyces rouxii]|uniref:Anaphase-promoting complex subunit 11 n=1 Tax=Zygosaccharomyces rouxii TaxID=4956 RepID=A0A1Q2ZT03_ZYGRO|nr:hypothetical protein ZYGR_0A02150 [Zygosaccharomyces rouxii]